MSVDARQLQVHQHQVGRLLAASGDALLAGPGGQHLEALVLQHIPHQLEVRGLSSTTRIRATIRSDFRRRRRGGTSELVAARANRSSRPTGLTR